jgi:hypothetical protein
MHEQICQVLGLSPAAWPPDHYALLGLKRGETDPQAIEQRVHERMRQLRPYQLSYPDQATEALNRLAQAYGCLMDPVARTAYDESLLALPPHPSPSPPGGVPAAAGPAREPAAADKELAAAHENGSVDPKDPLAWLFGPWDRLAPPESTSAPSAARPHFRDWAASAPPPPRRQSPASKKNPKSGAASPPYRPPEESNRKPLGASFFWRHSEKLLVILSLLALLIALWRTLAR